MPRRRGRQKSRRYGFFSFHDLRQFIPQKVENPNAPRASADPRLARIHAKHGMLPFLSHPSPQRKQGNPLSIVS
jgi:hypothetical protein